MLYEGVVLLGCALGKGLKPVGVVRHTLLLCPLHHAGSNVIGHMAVESSTVVDNVHHLCIHLLGQVFVHFLTTEHLSSEVLIGSFGWRFHFERLLLEGFAHYLKSQSLHNLLPFYTLVIYVGTIPFRL